MDQSFSPMILFLSLGAGGSLGLAVPEKNLSFGYVMNQFTFPNIEGTNPRFDRILQEIANKIN